MNALKKRSIFFFLSLFLFTAACASGSQIAKNQGGEPPAPVRVQDIAVAGEGESVEVTIEADGRIDYTAFQLSGPDRLILDMRGVDLSEFQDVIPVNKGPVKAIRPYYFESSNDSRLEMDLAGSVEYEVENSEPSRLRVAVKPGKTPPPVMSGPAGGAETATKAGTAAADMETMTVTGDIEGPARVVDVAFRQIEGLSKVEVRLSRPDPEFELIARDNLNRLTMNLPGAFITPRDERLINVALEESKVKNVAAFQFRGGDDPLAKVVVSLEENLPYNIYSEGSRVVLDMGDKAVLALATRITKDREGELAPEIVGAPETEYTGARISLDFQKADIHNILRIIADVSGYNIITSDNVKGQVTMKLRDVPWDQALEVILKNNGLDQIRDGNIIRVAPVAEIQREKEAQRQREETEKQIEPLYTKLLEVNYESASNMKKNLESLKSERGSIEINERTNTLIIKDTRSKLVQMESLIKQLDKKEQQVLIEARIVEVTHNKARELGIQWGGYANRVTNATFPNTIGVTGGAGASPNTGLGGVAVNLPTTASPTGALGITLGHINGTALLDARLMAMENQGAGRIISMPKITTMNNKEATIESGSEIPYQTVSADGTKTEFKKASLSLKVTPHVTPDRHVRLEIETNKDEPDWANQLPGAPPPIRTKQAKTEVLVMDGDTTVIGGLFKDTNQRAENRVPGFGELPLFGWLFKNRLETKTGEELLIFITPKIAE
ncbi:MAG: type IV pilus secretin PilQ [Candidatus Nitrospinota bacterium M3_3B_026]